MASTKLFSEDESIPQRLSLTDYRLTYSNLKERHSVFSRRRMELCNNTDKKGEKQLPNLVKNQRKGSEADWSFVSLLHWNSKSNWTNQSTGSLIVRNKKK